MFDPTFGRMYISRANSCAWHGLTLKASLIAGRTPRSDLIAKLLIKQLGHTQCTYVCTIFIPTYLLYIHVKITAILVISHATHLIGGSNLAKFCDIWRTGVAQCLKASKNGSQRVMQLNPT